MPSSSTEFFLDDPPGFRSDDRGNLGAIDASVGDARTSGTRGPGIDVVSSSPALTPDGTASERSGKLARSNPSSDNGTEACESIDNTGTSVEDVVVCRALLRAAVSGAAFSFAEARRELVAAGCFLGTACLRKRGEEAAPALVTPGRAPVLLGRSDADGCRLLDPRFLSIPSTSSNGFQWRQFYWVA
mmetsp:Transcript_50891/g.118901  ORF Transcript_50891/g.118901 Transcript_50891/m.118901 type:complete len:187 (-) Transcript_50891:12-572(-)